MKKPLLALGAIVFLSTACVQPDSASGTGKTTATAVTSTSTATSTSSGINAIQIITKGDSTGSFDNVIAPVSGGTLVKAQRIYNLDGSQIASGSIPSWFAESKIFLTSTRTTSGVAANTTSDTPCAYFDNYSTDNNPDSSGYYTVDGYNTENTIAAGTDIDQCAGTAAAELNQVGMYIKIDRRFMNADDKLQLIIKAKVIEEPNSAPTSSSCVVSGSFDAAACSNQLFTVSLRTAPAAATRPFFYLFPSAKALDLLSEAILLPIQSFPSVNTISIDRVKGGAIIYGVTLIRM